MAITLELTSVGLLPHQKTYTEAFLEEYKDVTPKRQRATTREPENFGKDTKSPPDMTNPEHVEWVKGAQNRRPKSIHQYCAKGSPTTTLKALWCICIFPLFPLKTSFLVYTKPLFWPVEALEFSELKTPLVYTFFPPIKRS